jgi:L-methionine (R)-S-oxide reductase
METYITVRSTSKKDLYEEILPQIMSMIKGEPDLTANLANIAAVLKMAFSSISWVGFYLLKGQELVLGPFQGKPACVRIAMGKGVCGTAALKRVSIIVPNVHQFPGHIFCDPDSKSEIVIPVIEAQTLYGVLDVDSHEFDAFDQTDRQYLERLVRSILPIFYEDKQLNAESKAR